MSLLFIYFLFVFISWSLITLSYFKEFYQKMREKLLVHWLSHRGEKWQVISLSHNYLLDKVQELKKKKTP